MPTRRITQESHPKSRNRHQQTRVGGSRLSRSRLGRLPSWCSSDSAHACPARRGARERTRPDVREIEAARDSGYLVLRHVISDVGRHPGPSPVSTMWPDSHMVPIDALPRQGQRSQWPMATSSSHVHRRILWSLVCVSARRLRLLSRLPMAILRGTPGGPTPSPERTHMPRSARVDDMRLSAAYRPPLGRASQRPD